MWVWVAAEVFMCTSQCHTVQYLRSEVQLFEYGARNNLILLLSSVNYNLLLPTGKLGLTSTEGSTGSSCEGSHSSTSLESDCTSCKCNMTYYCDCQLEAKIVEHHVNYRRRYACCPKQDDYACGYFEEVDPQYPNRAMEVIDDLVAEMKETRDVLLEERNNQYWMEEEDRAIKDGMRAEFDELKGVVGVAFTAIVSCVC
ncbi:hypothetical protein Cgig2_029860 [Carnegiea gigantea]|uniref:Uncharacterized protein n=1 Tax=Carnegiea gigantea TaxID=171969 RepID=A0A9Q1K511_9CARY|nr:hypothetical protein Cgig2_029860 [Carnegiea gigantea]